MNRTTEFSRSLYPGLSNDLLFLKGKSRPYRIRSERVLALCERLERKNPGSKELSELAELVSKDESLQNYLFEIEGRAGKGISSVPELKAAVAFHLSHPSWWEKNVEAWFEATSDHQRSLHPEGPGRTYYDIKTGIAKAVYHFGKDLVVGTFDLAKFGVDLVIDEKVREKTAKALGKQAWIYVRLQYGTPEQKRAAAEEVTRAILQVARGLKREILADWDKATETGRRAELISEWISRGFLEIATVLLAYLKGAKAAAEATELATKAAKAAEEVAAVQKAEKVVETIEPLVKLKKKEKRVSRVVRRSQRELLKDWYQDNTKLRRSHKKFRNSHIRGTDLSKPVRMLTLKRGTVIEQWIRVGGQPGLYCTYKNADAAKLGLNLQGRIRQRFVVVKPVRIVESTTHSFPKGIVPGVGGAGGEKQLIMPPDWERHVIRIE